MKRDKTSNTPKQGALPFRASVPSGRRGEPCPVWLDQVFKHVKARDLGPYNLTALQWAWDHSLSASQTASYFEAIERTREVAIACRHQITLDTIEHAPTTPTGMFDGRPTLSLLAPAPSPGRARKLRDEGLSVHAVARALGVSEATTREWLAESR